MNISGPFIARPIATSLLAIALLLAGLYGYLRLPVSSLPEVDFPTIQATTQLPGASPDTIAVLVTASLERQLAQISGLSEIVSVSGPGVSRITLQFNLGRDIDDAAQDVQLLKGLLEPANADRGLAEERAVPIRVAHSRSPRFASSIAVMRRWRSLSIQRLPR